MIRWLRAKLRGQRRPIDAEGMRRAQAGRERDDARAWKYRSPTLPQPPPPPSGGL